MITSSILFLPGEVWNEDSFFLGVVPRLRKIGPYFNGDGVANLIASFRAFSGVEFWGSSKNDFLEGVLAQSGFDVSALTDCILWKKPRQVKIENIISNCGCVIMIFVMTNKDDSFGLKMKTYYITTAGLTMSCTILSAAWWSSPRRQPPAQMDRSLPVF